MKKAQAADLVLLARADEGNRTRAFKRSYGGSVQAMLVLTCGGAFGAVLLTGVNATRSCSAQQRVRVIDWPTSEGGQPGGAGCRKTARRAALDRPRSPGVPAQQLC